MKRFHDWISFKEVDTAGVSGPGLNRWKKNKFLDDKGSQNKEWKSMMINESGQTLNHHERKHRSAKYECQKPQEVAYKVILTPKGLKIKQRTRWTSETTRVLSVSGEQFENNNPIHPAKVLIHGIMMSLHTRQSTVCNQTRVRSGRVKYRAINEVFFLGITDIPRSGLLTRSSTLCTNCYCINHEVDIPKGERRDRRKMNWPSQEGD